MPQEVKDVKFNDTIITKSKGQDYDYLIPGTVEIGAEGGSGVHVGTFQYKGYYEDSGVSRSDYGLSVKAAKIGNLVFTSSGIVSTDYGTSQFIHIETEGIKASVSGANHVFPEINLTGGLVRMSNTEVNGDFAVDGKLIVFNSDGSVTWVPFN